MGHSFKTRQHVCIGHSDYLETSTNINDECVHSNKKRAQTTDPGSRKHLLKTSTIMLRTRNNTSGITCNNTSGITEEDKRRDVRECEWWLWDLEPMGIWIGKDWEGSIRWVICLLGSLLVELLVIVIPYTAWRVIEESIVMWSKDEVEIVLGVIWSVKPFLFFLGLPKMWMGAYVVNYPVRPGHLKKKKWVGGQRADLGVERCAAFYSQLKSKVGNIIAKATLLLINLNIISMAGVSFRKWRQFRIGRDRESGGRLPCMSHVPQASTGGPLA